MKRKGIILAAGRGTRLQPVTGAINKQLLPIYDKPMIYYPLSLFLHAGIREILLIVDPEDLLVFKKVLGDGSHFGVTLTYETQTIKRGIADALIIGERFLAGAPSCLILGDNLLHGKNFSDLLRDCNVYTESGAAVLGYEVHDPERFGVVTFDTHGKAISLIEKPKNPTSNYAVPGIYFYDERAPLFAKKLLPSPRGELEITDLNMAYLKENSLQVVPVPKDVIWFDTGTFDSLLEASLYVQRYQKESGTPIANLESIAYSYGYITEENLTRTSQKLAKTSYQDYLVKALSNKKTS